jgi:hypothetical protein
MKEEYHVDMSDKIFRIEDIGIACLGLPSNTHNGCALRKNLIKIIKKNLCIGEDKEEDAKLYAICIYLLIKDKLDEISLLDICNDEYFEYVRDYLLALLDEIPPFEIISITEYRKKIGKDLESPADNYASAYRKRGLHRTRWETGISLNVIDINYSIIQELWDKLNEI